MTLDYDMALGAGKLVFIMILSLYGINKIIGHYLNQGHITDCMTYENRIKEGIFKLDNFSNTWVEDYRMFEMDELHQEMLDTTNTWDSPLQMLQDLLQRDIEDLLFEKLQRDTYYIFFTDEDEVHITFNRPTERTYDEFIDCFGRKGKELIEKDGINNILVFELSIEKNLDETLYDELAIRTKEIILPIIR